MLTLEEFERLAENDGFRVELTHGRLVREPRPGGEHGLIAGELVGRIHHHARMHGLGRVVTETGFLLTENPPTVRGPDVAFLTEKRYLEAGAPKGYWRIAPDLAIEIVSPSNTATEIQEKVLEFLEAGTPLVWVVDPGIRTVTEFRSKSEVRVLAEGDALDGFEVLPGFRLGISDLFAL